jgi:hypothetical protein
MAVLSMITIAVMSDHQVSVVLTPVDFKKIEAIVEARRKSAPMTSRGDVLRDLIAVGLRAVKT